MPARSADGRPATRLVCTLGPASRDRVDDLVAAGMAVARLNLAHASAGWHAAAVAAVRQASAAVGREVAVLADLPGPKVRLGELSGGAAELELGARYTLHAGLDELHGPGDASGAATTHPGLADDLLPGDRVWLSDGAVELVVEGTDGPEVRTTVIRGGRIRSRAGLGVPAERLSLPALSDRDLSLARSAAEAGVDFLGLSFVRAPGDVDALREIVGGHGPGIVAKIETRSAVERFDEIALRADGVMVARGDLGLELPFEAVPLLQKRLVRRSTELGRPVIVATQMLESMVAAARPTRAEASDVANAVLDGADAVMLSAETAVGAYPVLAAEAAIRICAAAEGEAWWAGDPGTAGHGPGFGPAPGAVLDPVAVAATALAEADPAAVALLVAMPDAEAAMHIAGRRPRVPVVVVVADARAARRLVLYRGLVPVVPADPGLVARDADVSGERLAADPAVAASLPAVGRIVVLTAPGGGVASRVDVLDRLPAAGTVARPES